jgi:hypothetical protein
MSLVDGVKYLTSIKFEHKIVNIYGTIINTNCKKTRLLPEEDHSAGKTLHKHR